MRRIPAPILGTAALLLLFALTMALPAMAAESIGTVIGVQGSVTAMDDSGTRALEMTSQVYLKDTILTGPDSKVQILFNDDTVLAQGPMSESSLEDYAYLEGGDEDSRFLLDMTEGTFRVITGKIVEDNPDEGFRMQTPLAVIGIRGTMTGHHVMPGEEHHYSLDLQGTHTVEVTTRFDQGLNSLTEDFQALDIRPGSPSGDSRDMTPEEQEFMNTATGITRYNPTPSSSVADGEGDGALDGDGNLLSTDGTLLDGNGSGSGENGVGTEVADTGALEIYLTGEVIPGTTITTTTYRTLAALFAEYVSPDYIGVQPYLWPVAAVGDPVTMQGLGVDYLTFNKATQTISPLKIDGTYVSGSLSPTYTLVGSTSDAQWGYWSCPILVNNGTGDYQLIRMYDVTVDVPTTVRPDLAGTYTGSASGVLAFNYATYTGTGTFTANITDITSGTINSSISVSYDSGNYVFSASGSDVVNNGVFTIPMSTATFTYTIPTPGSQAVDADVSGAVGTDGNMAGTFSFTESTDDIHGVGTFNATHN